MKKIDVRKLKKGDIILSTSTGKISAAIRFFTNSDISHAMLYVANSSVMDSTSEGVQARNIDKMHYHESCAIYAYRPVVELPEATLDMVVGYVRSETGAPYSLAEATVSPVAAYVRGGTRQFCSRLIGRAYARVGLRIGSNPDFLTPAEIQKSTQLIKLEDVTVSLSAEDVAALAQELDTTEGMRAVTSALLKRVRELSKSIRTLTDIEPFLLKNPQYDGQFASALVESGYTTFWQVEVARFPWRYDSVALAQLYHAVENKEEVLQYCRDTLRHDAEGDFEHWNDNLRKLGKLMKTVPLETFKLQTDLYLKLCFYHQQRVESAKMLLKVYDR
ncbi:MULTISPECIES: YiiX/YebB-like N1pC/P60 family cysteine hydrolase [unclassified Caballeronia]|uniref:YiiX/YebB-like N1pC/P60 family cysteine hydrolase n=1 Tax=unclassified Caballeronia TaxID=2646786 RepID=UPI00025BC31F|nr:MULTISPECIES: YiiX/YebB-like N1pC/P60 family cysteine hydrolase [unclassified Caballeronia]EKS70240.1 rcorf112 [Burkholderia sp. SJ98]MCE4546491.1 hypothetical protein [Caballeronia sp. PC1]MCE4573035.1 hypothetical protein [Caballeronia sp. CLC5]